MKESLKDFTVRRFEEELLKLTVNQPNLKNPADLFKLGSALGDKIAAEVGAHPSFQKLTPEEIKLAEMACTNKLKEMAGELNFSAARRLLDDSN